MKGSINVHCISCSLLVGVLRCPNLCWRCPGASQRSVLLAGENLHLSIYQIISKLNIFSNRRSASMFIKRGIETLIITTCAGICFLLHYARVILVSTSSPYLLILFSVIFVLNHFDITLFILQITFDVLYLSSQLDMTHVPPTELLVIIFS